MRLRVSLLSLLGAMVALFAFTSAPAFAASAPEVSLEPPSEVSTVGAALHGQVNPEEEATTYQFEYGTTSSYGSRVPATPASIGSGSVDVAVGQHISGLTPDTVYHFRLVATNGTGTTEGEDATFKTYPVPVRSEGCPNEAIREAQGSTYLPECRAYEMVSPVDKNGANIHAQNYKEYTASLSGDRLFFPAETGIGDTHGSGAVGFTEYVASRGASGWTTKGVTPTPAPTSPAQEFYGNRIFGLSDELQRGAVFGYKLAGVEGARTADTFNLYLENLEEAKLIEAATNGTHEGEPLNTFWQLEIAQEGGSSSDMGVLSFQMLPNLLPGTSGFVPKVYADEHGSLKLVGVLPDGSVPPGGSELAREAQLGFAVSGGAVRFKDTVSRDGSRILFLSPAFGEQQLYMRKNGSATVLISESEASTPTPAENVHFQAAAPDLKEVLFTTSTRLLDSDPGGSGEALYLYTDGPDPEHESNLTFIGRGFAYEQGIERRASSSRNNVLGVSEDGGRFYFMKQRYGNIFLWDHGQVHQITPEPGYKPPFLGAGLQEADVTPDGSAIAFISNQQLTRNQDRIEKGSEIYEMYLYDTTTDSLRCVSCPSSGAAITTGVEMNVGVTDAGLGYGTPSQLRFLSDDGRYVFFNSAEALLPQATNGLVNAYEYDTQTGRLSLLDSGSGGQGVWFVEAGASGRDAFLATRERLTPWDTDELADLYDARIGGGFPPPITAMSCLGDECQGTPSAVPSFDTAHGFHGEGNLVPAKPGRGHRNGGSLKRERKLQRALRACKRRYRHSSRRRGACTRAARRRYGRRHMHLSGVGH